VSKKKDGVMGRHGDREKKYRILRNSDTDTKNGHGKIVEEECES